MSTNVCKAPWVSITISADGTINPCCIYSGSKFNINTHTIDEAWSGFEPIRDTLLSGELPTGCSACSKRKDSIGSSRKDWFDERISFMPKYESNPKIELKHMDLNFGNVCNLKCRMCSSSRSTSWIKDEQKLYQLDSRFGSSSENGREIVNRLDMSTIEECREMFDGMERIDFKGGEPFMQESMYTTLEYLIDSGLSHKIEVSYVTNGTHRPEILKELFPYFKKIKLIISVESSNDALYRYIRGGNNYSISDLEETIAWFNRFDNLTGGFSSALHIYNAFCIGDTYRWMRMIASKYNRWKVMPMNCLVVTPKYLDIDIMPKELKELSLRDIQNIPSWYKGNLDEYLLRDTFDPEQWELFKEYTRALDSVRNESISEVVSELKDYFKVCS
jgi:MoaA/NifB/PqqE/SkfB family radical SAM enzyme